MGVHFIDPHINDDIRSKRGMHYRFNLTNPYIGIIRNQFGDHLIPPIIFVHYHN